MLILKCNFILINIIKNQCHLRETQMDIHSDPNTVTTPANRHRSAQTARQHTHTHTHTHTRVEAEPPNTFTVHGLWSLSVRLLDVCGRRMPEGASRGSHTAREEQKRVEGFLRARSHITVDR